MGDAASSKGRLKAHDDDDEVKYLYRIKFSDTLITDYVIIRGSNKIET